MGVAEAGSSSAGRQRQADMRLVRCGAFPMGSDKHYPEEAPVHRVTVDGLRMDPTPVTNRQFREFVEAAGYVTFAGDAPKPRCIPENPRGRDRGRQLRPLPAADQDSSQGCQGRLVSMRAKLLPSLPAGGASCTAGRHVNERCWLQVRHQRRRRTMSSRCCTSAFEHPTGGLFHERQ